MTYGQKINMWRACIEWNEAQIEKFPKETTRLRNNITILNARIRAAHLYDGDIS